MENNQILKVPSNSHPIIPRSLWPNDFTMKNLAAMQASMGGNQAIIAVKVPRNFATGEPENQDAPPPPQAVAGNAGPSGNQQHLQLQELRPVMPETPPSSPDADDVNDEDGEEYQEDDEADDADGEEGDEGSEAESSDSVKIIAELVRNRRQQLRQGGKL